jgi:hypothetical protein
MNPTDETEQKQYPEYVRGLRPGSSTKPVQHVNMYTRHFTQENIERGIRYLETQGETVPPIFMTLDTGGKWTTSKERLFWSANNGGSTLEVVPKERVVDLIREKWYQQDLPKGSRSLHSWFVTKYLGVSASEVARFVRRQESWQLQKPLRKKGKARQSVVSSRPFQLVEIDIAVMTSFDQGGAGDPTCLMVLCDVFSGFCMAEVQLTKEAPETLKSLKKMVAAVRALGYAVPKVLKSDQGPEFSSPHWKKYNAKMGWKRIWTKDYPAVHVERKIRTVKKYIYLNSIGNFGMETLWWNVVTSSVMATNRILNKTRKGSPEQILRMDIQERRVVKERVKSQKKRAHQNDNYIPKKGEPQVGDSVRVRLMSEKLPQDYKSHFPYDKEGFPIKWSDDLHRVERKTIGTNGVVRVFVDGRYHFWPSEVQAVPEDTEAPPTWGQDGNVDFVKPRRGERRSKRVRRTS